MAKSHDHTHHHCSHARLRYCATCQRPYCLDCGQEWYPSGYTYWYTNTYPAGTSDTPWTTTVTCYHNQQESVGDRS